ncbi:MULTISPECIES: zf-HC2 domain-containing protein [Arthrobacter]|uniref:Zf-HC2 domain-containing protein n=2 Tax=Arthrobacter TaxID=1663 RepID=A0ABU9KP30_9MICC|nr:zf-HC2 domain-containing protein [Arthrobacter sp. YJM1]MDP5228642.1 zf-HC2 domain-containing protein [Arthrobacter sp. YJM1]
MSHEEMRLSLGAYILGGLDAEETRAVEAHLATCAECRAEAEGFEMLPALLDAVPVSRAMALAPAEAPVEAVAPPVLLAKVRARRRVNRLRWGAAAAAVAAAALVGGVALGPVVNPAGPIAVPAPAVTQPAPVARYTLSSADGVQVDVALVRKNWGTELELSCHGMLGEGVYSVWVSNADGGWERAASWSSSAYQGTAVLTGATAQQPSAIRGIQIRDEAQHALASLTIG